MIHYAVSQGDKLQKIPDRMRDSQAMLPGEETAMERSLIDGYVGVGNMRAG
jgi:hypothetical protein